MPTRSIPRAMVSGDRTTPAKPRSDVLSGMIAITTAGVAIRAWVALPTQQGFVALAVLIIVGAVAVWKRPPIRDATGRPIRLTTVVNAVLVVGIFAIPVGIAAVGLAFPAFLDQLAERNPL